MDGAPRGLRWYRVASAPPKEEVDWLSPITSSYMLCATKSGKVVCWDVQTDTCLAECNPGKRWELWKCRVEFEEKTVYFIMAKIVNGSYDDERAMEFVLMRLSFSDSPSGESSSVPPVFLQVMDFKTVGVVMNVFLLDPTARLLSAFVWVSSTNTVGLYALPDWDKPEYVFIDTGIECTPSSNWSCILYERNIVIHCEGSEGASQHFYPLHLLQAFTKRLKSKTDVPFISYSVSPARSLHRKFIFPYVKNRIVLLEDGQLDPAGSALEVVVPPASTDAVNGLETTGVLVSSPSLTPSPHTSATPSTLTAVTTTMPVPPETTPLENPFPFPPWCPDSAHFVRQWWPSLPNIPRVSCTVVLLSSHDQFTHRTRFILAQHYFRVPLTHEKWVPPDLPQLEHRLVGAPHPISRPDADPPPVNGHAVPPEGETSSSTPRKQERAAVHKEEVKDDALMHLWYVSTPFEVCCIPDGGDEDDEGGDRPRPLVAVDFGHAVWIEFVDNEDDPERESTDDPDAKWMRFVTFPPFGEDLEKAGEEREEGSVWSRTGGVVRTLKIPDELNLDKVETLNIDQSQGAVIVSVKQGKIFILCYE
ncbi:hypothetical protein DXG03_008721 [Asterophora parasitica]|uniref:Uncharacterized protein n=1 Tax=Asterophora parasitica TaxID=117018 RepID=A0A9P7G677_9AGAR|nr:hypothetical protein DXG03_008721 [Asterophora parasitica]